MEKLHSYHSNDCVYVVSGKYAEVYNCQFKLARYFQGTNDKWLADHFFEACLATTSCVKGDEGKMAAEGHCNVGLAQEEHGSFDSAAQNYESFYRLTEDHTDWIFEEDKNMHCESCKHLARIYTTIAHGHEEAGDMENFLQFLNRACDMAVKGILPL